MRRPARSALPVVGLLLILGIPFLHARFAPADERALPTSSPSRQVSTDLQQNYPIDRTRAITVVATASRAGMEPLAAELSRLPGVVAVDGASGRFSRGARLAPPGPEGALFVSGDAEYLVVLPGVSAESDDAQTLVRSIRALPDVAGQHLLVGGPTAVLIDTRTALTGRLGLALVVVVTAMFVVLFLFTNSIVVPIKALLLNALALGAVLGAMVWLFQDGHLVQHLGVTPAPLNLGMVVLLCTIVFGLSVDYEIFLLSRIKEARDAGANTVDATVEGLGRVGRIVSAAAALLTVTLFSFSNGLSFMKMFGIGTGFAILLDATLIRGVLVPAFMRVAGDLNWWAPRPLRRFVR
jgi:RND superfamily putative drug exporter